MDAINTNKGNAYINEACFTMLKVTLKRINLKDCVLTEDDKKDIIGFIMEELDDRSDMKNIVNHCLEILSIYGEQDEIFDLQSIILFDWLIPFLDNEVRLLMRLLNTHKNDNEFAYLFIKCCGLFAKSSKLKKLKSNYQI